MWRAVRNIFLRSAQVLSAQCVDFSTQCVKPVCALRRLFCALRRFFCALRRFFHALRKGRLRTARRVRSRGALVNSSRETDPALPASCQAASRSPRYPRLSRVPRPREHDRRWRSPCDFWPNSRRMRRSQRRTTFPGAARYSNSSPVMMAPCLTNAPSLLLSVPYLCAPLTHRFWDFSNALSTRCYSTQRSDSSDGSSSSSSYSSSIAAIARSSSGAAGSDDGSGRYTCHVATATGAAGQRRGSRRDGWRAAKRGLRGPPSTLRPSPRATSTIARATRCAGLMETATRVSCLASILYSITLCVVSQLCRCGLCFCGVYTVPCFNSLMSYM